MRKFVQRELKERQMHAWFTHKQVVF